MLVHTINFKVKGTTFKNEEGKDIQKEIKKVLNGYKKNNFFNNNELFDGYTDKEIKELDLNVSEFENCKFPAKLVGDEYNGEECFKIYIKTYDDGYIHIGYAPKKDLIEISEWITKDGLKVTGVLQVTGGKYKHCEYYEEDYEGKERIVCEEITYGAKITLEFCDNKPSLNTMQTATKEIKREQNTASIVITVICFIFILLGIWIFSKIWSFIDWLIT